MFGRADSFFQRGWPPPSSNCLLLEGGDSVSPVEEGGEGGLKGLFLVSAVRVISAVPV